MKLRLFTAILVCIAVERYVIQPLRRHKGGHYRTSNQMLVDQRAIAVRPGKVKPVKYASVAPPPVETKSKRWFK